MAVSNMSTAESDSKEDPLVEINGIRGTELVRKSQIKDLDTLVVRCTVCRKQINHLDYHKVKRHIRLKVIICTDCYDFYGTDEFSQDESGKYNYCTWCGNGGQLFICESCPNVFCMNCVRRNFGRAEVATVQKDGWLCYVCLPDKIKTKVAYCDLIFHYSKGLSKKAKETEEMKDKELISETWVLESFTKTENACKSLIKKMDKLKHVEATHSKSVKHIIKKMEELIGKHKTELGSIIKTLSNQYVSYIKLKQSEEKFKLKNVPATNGVSTDHDDDITIISDSEEDVKKSALINNKQKKKVNDKTVSAADNKTLNEHFETHNANNTEISDKQNSCSNKLESKDSDTTKNISLKTLKEEKEPSIETENLTSSKLELKSEVNDAPMDIDDSLDKYNVSMDNDDTEKLDTVNNLPGDSDAEIAAKMDILKDSSEDSDSTAEAKNSKNSLASKKSSKGIKSKNYSNDAPPKTNNITVTAEVHSSELQNDSDFEKASKIKKKPPYKGVKTSESISKNCVIKESSMSSLDSLSDSDSSAQKLKSKKKKSQAKPAKKKAVEIDYVNDVKLRLNTSVIMERCDDLLDGKTTIKVPAIFLLDELDKTIKRVTKEPEIIRKVKGPKSAQLKKIPPKKEIGKKIRKDSSSSIVFSSDEEDAPKKEEPLFISKSAVKDDLEEQIKKEMLDTSDSSSINLTDSEAEKKKKVKKKTSAKNNNTDSSDDFQPKKKKKVDKLLSKRILSENDSENETTKEKKKNSEKKRKRKLASSGEDSKKNESRGSTTSSSSDDEKRPKSKRKRRIKKKALNSSSEDKQSGDEDKDKTETPKKGRKDLRKKISKKDLQHETLEAQQAEKERKKRIEEKQKLYNVMTTPSKDGKEMITTKLVLEVDPVSKEEIVQIHPDLIEKLKPHQVNGVKFMWECTIESLKELKKGKGSGCILAHCMGLGKTLQCVTFLHTCLTNKEVNKYIRTAMVICPYNTVLNWSREIEMWLSELDTPPITMHEMTVAKDNPFRLDILKFWQKEGGILIISYDIFRRLSQKKLPKLKKSQIELVHQHLLDPGPDIVVCDEGHILKNEASAISKACCLLRTQRRIVLTGTPLQNNLKEYHCMLSFVKPNLLGTMKEFRNRFVNPIMNGQYEDSNEYDVRRMKKRIHILHKLLEGCVQRCDYAALTKFLPPKHEYVLSVKLSEVQIKLYRWYLDSMSKAKGEDKIKGSTLFQDYNVLRNLCAHPYILHTSHERFEEKKMRKELFQEGENEDEYESSFVTDGSGTKSSSGGDTDEIVREYKTRSRRRSASVESVKDDEEEKPPEKKAWYFEFISEEDRFKIELSGKIVLLVNILKECESIGDKVIVFSQSLLTLDNIEDMLEEFSKTEENCTWIKNLDYFRMDGSTSADFRKNYIDMFNNTSNTRARLFLVSTRAGGLGTNLVGANRVVIMDASWNPSHDVQAIFRVYRFGQKKPVYIYRLLGQATMEEKIYDRQVSKLSLSIRVVDEQQIDRHFNASELAELYTFEPDVQKNRPTPVVPSDRLLAEMLINYQELIVSYHEHDSLLQNETEEDLTEAERKAAWAEFENEREGKTNDFVDEEVLHYCAEPDFNQADYDSPAVKSVKFIIDDLLSKTKVKCQGQSIPYMRKTLLNAIKRVKNFFQEKHVVVLRMKQEFLAKGSVPSTVNKYLEELTSTLTQLNQHYAKVYELVVADDKQAAAEYQLRFAQQASARAAFHSSMPAGVRIAVPPGVRLPNMNNFAYYGRMPMPGQSTYVRPFPAHTQSRPQPQFHRQQMPNRFTQTAPTSQPVITEAAEDTPEEVITPDNSSKMKSSVVIQEID